MNESLQSKLSEVIGANNISYILNDNKNFSVTGYKVMQNHSNAGLLRCAKIMYNGKIKLVYLIDGHRPLSNVATRLGVNELNAVILRRLQNNINGKEYEQKFVEPDRVQPNYSIKKDIQYTPPVLDPQKYTPPVADPLKIPQNPSFNIAQPPLSLIAINSPVQLVLLINKPEYLIGKNPNMVDGAITYNPAISRVHCKITFVNGKYYLTDLGSANGTYVNQKLLDKQQTIEIKNGDYLKFANSDFIISF